jgi:hypothetical protein
VSFAVSAPEVSTAAVANPARSGAAVHARRVRRSAAVLGGAFAFYLLVSIVLWWHVWSSHPTTVTTCGCGDSALFLWFLEWPAYALAHGHNPFFSTALFHPGGINLLANTSVLAIGIPLAPITWLFGPVATLNVALTLGPALSALTMFWLLRRWVRWTPAALAGGLVFGFSPFVVLNLAGAHLMAGVLLFLPLMVACLDELLVRQERSPLRVGAVLGLLLTAQFFLGTELLTIVVLCMAVGVGLLVAYAAICCRGELAKRGAHAWRGLAAAGGVALALLAYPVWFTLDGPAHLSGLVWPAIHPGSGGIGLPNLWHLSFANAESMKFFSGYQGPPLPPPEYLGLGMIIVLVAGVVAWRRDRRLWFFGALGVITLLASLGVKSYWTPWRLLTHVPLVQNVIPSRLVAISSLCVAIMLAIVIDRAHRSVRSWAKGLGSTAIQHRQVLTGRLAGAVAGFTALVLVAVALVPIGSALASNTPLTTRAVTLPGWFSDIAPHLPPGQVLLTYPPPGIGSSTLAWQAVDSLHFAMAMGVGPESILQRAGKERAGQSVINAAAFSFDGPPKATAANIDAVRQALTGWGVTTVAVADPKTLVPPFGQFDNTAWTIALFTIVLHRLPQFSGDTWVWRDVTTSLLGSHYAISASAFAGCTGTQIYQNPSRLAVPSCVLSAAQRSS